MCGRYVVTNPVTKTNKIVKSAIQVEDKENYNAHPYQKLPVIKKYKNGNTLENLKWGIVPSWSKKKDFKPLINARLETIDEKGNNLGVIDTKEAIKKASDVGLDLVEVSPQVDPPVCKILDFGKFKYEAQKKASTAKKKQKEITIK